MTTTISRESFIGVQLASESENVHEDDVRHWAQTALESESRDVCVRITSIEESQRLNRLFRLIDKPTNVLAFPSDSESLLGDVVVCMNVVRKESVEQGKTTRDHLAHLIVHGILHLRGFSHAESQTATQMEQKELALLDTIGIANPYE